MRFDVYNKIFTKILDSSIWLEPDATRIVWLTLLAAMDQDGFAQFASVANLAHRAIVPVEAAQTAVEALEGPDGNSSDPDHGGRRIERVPGGWIVLNAEKYKTLVTRLVQREQNRERVRKHRRNAAPITAPLQDITCNGSETETDVQAETQKERRTVATRRRSLAKEPNQNGNYRVIAKLATDLLKSASPASLTSESELVDALKDECGRLGIARDDIDVIHRAAASAWFKYQHPDIT